MTADDHSHMILSAAGARYGLTSTE